MSPNEFSDSSRLAKRRKLTDHESTIADNATSTTLLGRLKKAANGFGKIFNAEEADGTRITEEADGTVFVDSAYDSTWPSSHGSFHENDATATEAHDPSRMEVDDVAAISKEQPSVQKSARKTTPINDEAVIDPSGQSNPPTEKKTPARRIAAESPAPGMRSSGRRRRKPQRFEDEAVTPQTKRRAAASKTAKSPTNEEMQAARADTEDDEMQAAGSEDDDDKNTESEPKAKRARPATRARKAAAPARRGRGKQSNSKTTGEEAQEADEEAPLPDDIEDLDQPALVQEILAVTTLDVVSEQEETGLLGVEPPAAPATYVEKFQEICRLHDMQEHLAPLATCIMKQLTGASKIPLIGHEDAYRKIQNLIEQTVTVGEGNSILLLGPRGCGKTALVETAIASLSKAHKEDFHVIRLNGFLLTDDRLALREIWRQLGREMEVDEEDNKVSSYADTMASLLALLSHPEEYGAEEGGVTAKAVVFIMDEFDLFATHPRQTLLYNLFDIAQARKAPIAVLGLSTKVDIAEHLEKRVKSRFSHRYVYMSLPKNFVTFSEICKAGLSNHEAGGLFSSVRPENPLTAAWQAYLDDLWKEASLKEHLQHIYYTTKSVATFFSGCLSPMAGLAIGTVPTVRSLINQTHLVCPDSKLHLLNGLSDMELALLISACRLQAILGIDSCNFNMAYHEYQSIAAHAKLQASVSGAAAAGAGTKIWGRDICLGAWEKLAESELIVPSAGGGGAAAGTHAGLAGAAAGGARDTGQDGRMFRVDVALEEISPSVPGLSSMMVKWCKHA